MYKDGKAMVPDDYTQTMTIARKISFTHPDQYFELPADFVGKWQEYEKAENSGKSIAQDIQKSKSKRR